MAWSMAKLIAMSMVVLMVIELAWYWVWWKELSMEVLMVS
jgi:hypothetical protein